MTPKLEMANDDISVIDSPEPGSRVTGYTARAPNATMPGLASPFTVAAATGNTVRMSIGRSKVVWQSRLLGTIASGSNKVKNKVVHSTYNTSSSNGAAGPLSPLACVNTRPLRNY
ncbi:hypothetical protein BGW80DRAFT_1255064 [Lactifluus volemus]|nr:hypothetical protein BGW80DRAFT_1255064 [Lactifluus volemus]